VTDRGRRGSVASTVASGPRSVVTALYAEAGESIEEIARFVGHASPVTTAGYVRDLGNRPAAFAERAARLLDPAAGGP
jgi:hypothetical protein